MAPPKFFFSCTFLLFLTTIVLVLLPYASYSKKPNIVFIVSDDLGYDDLGFQSNQILTPNIDAYRSEGQFLEWYYGQCVCSATRSTILTGRYPLHTGINGWIHPDSSYGIPLNHLLLSNILQDNDYDTHAVGKWHLGFYKWEYTPTFRGFNSFYGYYTGGEDYFTHIASNYYDFRYDSKPNCGVDCSQVEVDAYNEYSAQLFTDQAINIIENYNSSKHDNVDEPLFLYLAYQSVHAPNNVLARYEDIYGGDPSDNVNYINNTERRIFAGMVTCMDEGIGNVTDALKKYGLFDENLIVIFTSDNGGPIPGDDGANDIDAILDDAIGARNWPLRGGKHSIWEGGTRITGLIWSTPDIISRNLSTINGNYSQLMHTVDWLPTLLDATEISSNISYIDGVSQWDGILGKYDSDSNGMGAKFDIRDNIYYGRNAYSDPSNETGYQYQGYKVLNNSGGVPTYWYGPVTKETDNNEDATKLQWMVYDGISTTVNSNATIYQLFNLTSDPTEHFDISGENSDLVATLIAKMAALEATGVPQGSNDPSCPNISHPIYPDVGGVWEPWCSDL